MEPELPKGHYAMRIQIREERNKRGRARFSEVAASRTTGYPRPAGNERHLPLIAVKLITFFIEPMKCVSV
jgi:hypothetical protein